LKKTIFIIGSGRSGTTLLFDILSRHRECGYFNQYNNKFPKYMFLSMLSRVRDSRLLCKYSIQNIQSKKLSKYFPKPAKEANNIWKIWDNQIKTNDFLKEYQNETIKYVKSLLKWQGKERFISKNTNHILRLKYLDRIFEAPFFIHIIRDPRAVINSLLNVDWDNLIFWWKKDSLTLRQLKNRKVDLVKLWTENMKREINSLLINQDRIKARLITVKYEDLTEETYKTTKCILNFCGMKIDSNIKKFLSTSSIQNRNYKWKNNLKSYQVDFINKETEEIMKSFGYR